MTDADFNILVNRELQTVRESTPKHTGNLAYSATKVEALGQRSFAILVNTDIAPYFKYVNHRAFLGKNGNIKNKNFEYWQNATEKVITDIAVTLGGRVER